MELIYQWTLPRLTIAASLVQDTVMLNYIEGAENSEQLYTFIAKELYQLDEATIFDCMKVDSDIERIITKATTNQDFKNWQKFPNIYWFLNNSVVARSISDLYNKTLQVTMNNHILAIEKEFEQKGIKVIINYHGTIVKLEVYTRIENKCSVYNTIINNAFIKHNTFDVHQYSVIEQALFVKESSVKTVSTRMIIDFMA